MQQNSFCNVNELKLSKVGIEQLSLSEHVVKGLYNDSSKLATFGIGLLVDKRGSKTPQNQRGSLLLAGAKKWKAQHPKSEIGAYFHETHDCGKKRCRIAWLAIGASAANDFSEMIAAIRKTIGSAQLVKLELEEKLIKMKWEDYYRDEFLGKISKEYEDPVKKGLTGARLKQHQYDALVSIVYNAGPGCIKAGTSLNKAVREFAKCEQAFESFPSIGKLNDSKLEQRLVRAYGELTKAAEVLCSAVLQTKPTETKSLEVTGNTFGDLQQTASEPTRLFSEGIFNRRVRELHELLGPLFSGSNEVVAWVNVNRTSLRAESEGRKKPLYDQASRKTQELYQMLRQRNMA